VLASVWHDVKIDDLEGLAGELQKLIVGAEREESDRNVVVPARLALLRAAAVDAEKESPPGRSTRAIEDTIASA